MIVFPNAKINIGLQVTEKRADGYHNLDTIFYPIPLKDSLEIVPFGSQDEAPADDCSLHLLGQRIEGAPGDNLVMRAWRILREAGYDVPPVSVWLYKHIPSGAGLGGGSADASFMLSTLDQMFRLHVGSERLAAFAARLGADCPFFLHNVPMYARGTGDILTPISLSLSGCRIVVVKPPVSVSTREAFADIIPTQPEQTLEEKIRRPLGEWKDIVTNDFEKSVFARHPELKAIKEQLYSSGALYASMSGSGSALYGLFPAQGDMPSQKDFPSCFVWEATL